MATVSLHIGLPKTGTSAVQGAIQALHAQIEALGVWTPARVMAHHRLAVAALDADDARLATPHYQRVLGSGNDAVLAQFAKAVQDGRNVLLSSEYLNAVGPGLVRALLERHGVRPPDVRIVVCLRRQDRFLESNFNQEVKRTGRTQPLTWSRRNAAPLDWYHRLSAWADAFGDDAIRVLVYERLQKSALGAQFARAHLEACGVALPAGAYESLSGEAADFANLSLPASLLEFKQAANSVIRVGELEWLLKRAMDAGMSGARLRLPPAVAAEMVRHYQASNALVARRFLKEDGPLFDDVVEPAAAQPGAFDTMAMAQLIAVMAAEIGRLRKQADQRAPARPAPHH